MENPESQEYKRFHALEQTNICARCGANIITMWDSKQSLYTLVCTHDPKHQGYRRRPSDTEMIKRGQLDDVKGPGHQADMEKFIEAHPGAISLAPTQDVATRQTLSPVQVKALEDFARTIHVFAFLGHVCLYFGKPYVTIDGFYYLKNKQKQNFAVVTLPMTSEERLANQVPEGSFAYISHAISSGGDIINTGLGIVTGEEIETHSKKNPDEFAAPVVHNHPQRMAEKRAEWQLLRKMIPLGAEVPVPEPKPREPLPKAPSSEQDAEMLWDGMERKT